MERATRVRCTDYEVVVGSGLLGDVAGDITAAHPSTSYVVITDTNVAPLYGGALRDALTAIVSSSAAVHLFAIAPGEASKTREQKELIEDWMLARGCDRQTCVIALGGGVVGDMSGFVASTFMRGVKYVQVPTTLLAMVDSSIGGKTGVDCPAGKNLIGSFHRPRTVYTDCSVLATLPPREFFNGMAEVIKTGAIRSESLFCLLEQNAEQLIAKEPVLLEQMILESVRIKADVVNRDEKEGGLRAILNFGHSVGHGIEALLQPSWLHGECVAVGMIKEAEISRALGSLSPDALNRLLGCLQAYQLPVACPDLGAEDIMTKMAVDKKNVGGTKRIVMLKCIGDAGTGAHAVGDSTIRLVLAPGVRVNPSGPINGSIRVPGSKSVSNRVLLMAALGKGRCVLRGLLHSDDTKVMMAALQKLGVAAFEFQDNGRAVVVHGSGGQLTAAQQNELYLSNAGTASRFLTTTCTLALGPHSIVTGNKRMKERPIRDLVDALRANGCEIEYLGTEGCPPLRIAGKGFPGGTIELAANISSQYVSSVLISAPYAKSPTTLKLTNSVVSQPYIEMTVELMRLFGAEVTRNDDGSYSVAQGAYTNPEFVEVESDASSASYPLAMAAITGGKVTVESIGTESLQGDAKFCRVLEAMGCEVTQGKDHTTVACTAGESLKGVEVDMGDVTDTFMTAAVVMATLPKGTVSRITNIANQRVKECNRIEAMITELAKCGVTCTELETGLEIIGAGPEPPAVLAAGGADIHCYKDHRIAMSFGVLGCAWPNIRITDKECVDKTYPAFWDDLNLVFSVRCAPSIPSPVQRASDSSSAPSVLLIGMRGCGKTTLGQAAARFHDMDSIDLDQLLGNDKIKEVVATQGWDAFRDMEEKLLRETVAKHPSGAVIACGGGIVERPANRAFLQQCGLPVVWIQRSILDICAYLDADGSRPAYGAEVQDVWARRQPLYLEASSHEFVELEQDQDLESIALEFSEFVGRILCRNVEPLRSQTFFLSLTYPDLAEVEDALWPALTRDIHSVELRVDLLRSYEPAFVHQQVALLRRRSRLPIIFTVRSKGQGGGFDGSEAEFFALLGLGPRAACEFVDVEACWSEAARGRFLASRGGSRAIGSLHFREPCASADRFLAMARTCSHGEADIVKLVFTAHQAEDCFVVREALDRLPAAGIRAPCIALLMGKAGKLSRVFNTFMTPVTHPLLPSAAAPGQLFVREILFLREALGVTRPLKYYIFGEPVQMSPSPLMHNTGFEALGLGHTYGRCETGDVARVAEVLKEPTFGGGSVTIPLKQAVIPLLDHLSAAAEAIGAVNTIIKEEDGRLLGANTDWLGIQRPLSQFLQDRPRKTALVVGAGGTALAAAYALGAMGFESILFYNRTQDRARTLADRFAGRVVPDLAGDLGAPLDVIISTLPPIGFTVPAKLLESKTALIEQAEAAGCGTISGISMLIEQGLSAQNLWTMRAPLSGVVRRVTNQVYDQVMAAVPEAKQFPDTAPADVVAAAKAAATAGSGPGPAAAASKAPVTSAI